MSKKCGCGCNNTVVMPCDPCRGNMYGNGFGSNNIIWLILLLGLCGNNGFGNGCGCDDNCGDNTWLLLILLLGCGGNGGFGGQGFC